MSVAVAVAPPAREFDHNPSLSLDIRGVSHQFDLGGARLPVLSSINLNVAAGEFVALLGPSGCGKSTLLRLVAGLEAPAARSGLHDLAAGLMTRNCALISLRALAEMFVINAANIRPADRRGLHAQQNFSMTRNRHRN